MEEVQVWNIVVATLATTPLVYIDVDGTVPLPHISRACLTQMLSILVFKAKIHALKECVVGAVLAI